MRTIAALILTLSTGLAAQAPSGAKPVIDNERVTVWDVNIATAMPAADALRANDAVIVFLAPEVIQGVSEFWQKGAGIAERLKASGAERAAVISLKEHAPVPPLENKSGYPDAFPRPGAKIILANARIAIWDNTFTPGTAPFMHFHSTDVVTIYLKDGTLISTTPDGTKTNNPFTFGTIRYNLANRTHTESFLEGGARNILVELK